MHYIKEKAGNKMFKGVIFFLKLFAKNGKIYLVLKPAGKLISIILSTVNILLPGMIIDQLMAREDIKIIIVTVSALVLSNVAGGILIHIFDTKGSLCQIYVFQKFQVQLAEKISHAG